MNRTSTAVFIAICLTIAVMGTISGCSSDVSNNTGAGDSAKNSDEATLEPENTLFPDKPDEMDNRPLLVAFGNSLTEGSGVDPTQNYPTKLQARIDAEGYRYRVINSGVSGETSAQGLNRTETIAALKPAIVIVEFGANDGLRGVPAATIHMNLEKIVSRLQTAGAKVVLAGMELPPNYGAPYTRAFRSIFSDISEELQAPLIPFFLNGVGGQVDLNQPDGIHPTAEGYDVVVENVWKVLAPLL